MARDSIRSIAPGAGICGVDRRGAMTSSAGRPGRGGKTARPGAVSSSSSGGGDNFSSSDWLNSTRSANSRMLIRWSFRWPCRLAPATFAAGFADRVATAAGQLVTDFNQLTTTHRAGRGDTRGFIGCR